VDQKAITKGHLKPYLKAVRERIAGHFTWRYRQSLAAARCLKGVLQHYPLNSGHLGTSDSWPVGRAACFACGTSRAAHRRNVGLVTKAFDEIKIDSRIGRAEALRRSMLSLIAAEAGIPTRPIGRRL